MFYDNFCKLCKDKKLKPTNVALEIGISRATATKWKKGSIPSGDSLIKLADYFGVSVNELLSDNAADTKKEVVPVGTTSRDEQSDYIMHALSSMPKDMLDNIEEICRLYNNDPGTDNQKFVNAIRSLLDLNK